MPKKANSSKNTSKGDGEESMEVVSPETAKAIKRRIEIVSIEVTKCNGNKFWGPLPDSVIRSIWTKTFRRNEKEIDVYNFKQVKNRHLEVNFELKKPMLISDISPTSDFYFYYKTLTGTNLMFATIRDYDYKVKSARIGDTVVVSVLRTASEVRSSQMKEWLNHFGQIIEPHWYDKDSENLNTGNFHVKLQLKFDIPEFLPMFGTKARIFYPGMKKQCSRCYRIGHLQKFCSKNRIDWLDYIERLIDTGLYPKNLFGNWIEVLDDRDGKIAPKRPYQAEEGTPIKPPRRYRQFENRGRRDGSPRQDVKRDDRRKRDRSPYHEPTSRRRTVDYRDRSPRKYTGNYQQQQQRHRDRSPRRTPEKRRDRSPRDDYRDDHRAKRSRDRSPIRAPREYSPRHRSTPSGSTFYDTPNSSNRSVTITNSNRRSAKARLGNRSNEYQGTPWINKKRFRDDDERETEGEKGSKQAKEDRDRGY